MGLWGDSIHEKNMRLRFYAISLIAVLFFAVILYWRSELIYSQDYVEFVPLSDHASITRNQPLNSSEQADELRKEMNNEQN